MLFPESLVPGLDHGESIIGEDDERELISRLQTLELAPFKFQGWVGKRRTHSFGYRYDFDDATFSESDPIPDWLLPLQQKAASFAGTQADALMHVLLARYDPGAGIGWHRDRPVFDQVIGISLGSPATLRFRQRVEKGFRRASLLLHPRSAYLLSGEARSDWEHSIAPGEQLRFSITFRTLSERGRIVAARGA